MERIEAAEKRAKDLLSGQVESESSLVDILKWRICCAYNMPFFDPYFDGRTLDDLVFEVTLIKETKTPQTNIEKADSILKAAPQEERESLFDDWNKIDNNIPESQFKEDAKRFMESGEFKK